MTQNFAMDCTNCHGDITEVAPNTSPWLIEPKCSNSGYHGSGYDTPEALYRQSTCHSGIYCEVCLDSTQAITSSREMNDSLKFYQLQGHTGSLAKYTVCHHTGPTTRFVIGL